MKKAAILLAKGFEEGETLFVVDILRRANLTCTMFSTEAELRVEGGQSITVECTDLLSDLVYDYDMVILPGGKGTSRLKQDKRVLDIVRRFDRESKQIAAICAAPSVLFEAGITKGRTLTSYPGEYYEKLFVESVYKEEIVVVDENWITSRGPATTLPFAYAIVDALGGDSDILKDKMLYSMVAPSLNDRLY